MFDKKKELFESLVNRHLLDFHFLPVWILFGDFLHLLKLKTLNEVIKFVPQLTVSSRFPKLPANFTDSTVLCVRLSKTFSSFSGAEVPENIYLLRFFNDLLMV